ncbi:MAG: sporulation protein YqfD [Lachnospiraceae bacterium]|nr:sporulation protein YqfD [Lachnospiraceae bacterium]
MLLIILRFVFGYVKAEVYGFAPERFMNLIIKNDVVIWDVESSEQGYIFYTGRKNLLKLKPYLQKTNMKLKLIEKYGLPYFFKKHRKRAAFLLGFLLFGTVVYILSLFVWEVKVTGEDKLVAETVLKQIESEYVSLGTLKSHIDCSKLEESLRRDFDEISWISCELKGTGLTVYLEEGMAPKKTENEITNGDIIASKDALITKMITRQGTPVAKVNDTVKKGDILISGTIYIYDDNNEIMETSYIAADGDIYGTTTFEYEDYVDLKYYQKVYDDKSKTHVTLYFLDYCLTPFVPKMENKDYDTYTQIHKARIFDNFYLPFGYKSIKRTPYTLEAREYSEAEAKEMLVKRLDKKIKSFTEKGVEIMENNVTIEKADGRLVAKGTLTLTESIAILKKSSGGIPDEDKD